MAVFTFIEGFHNPTMRGDLNRIIMDEDVEARTRRGAIVTVADAYNLPARLEDSHEAQEQIAFAHVIPLNRTHLVTADELALVESWIRTLNPQGRLHRKQRAALPMDQIPDPGRLRSLAHPGSRARFPHRRG